MAERLHAACGLLKWAPWTKHEKGCLCAKASRHSCLIAGLLMGLGAWPVLALHADTCRRCCWKQEVHHALQLDRVLYRS